MEIFNYSPVTGEFLGASEARPSPLEEGVFLIPAHATDIAPPAAQPHKKAVWMGSAWRMEDDRRGEIWFGGPDGRSPVRIGVLGMPSEAGLTPEPRPKTADEVKGELLAHAAAKRYDVETGGVVVGGSRIATDRASQAMVSGAFTMAKDNPEAVFEFKAEAGFVTLDAETMIAVGRAVGAHVQAAFAIEATLAAAIAAGGVTTPEEIDGADWPPNS